MPNALPEARLLEGLVPNDVLMTARSLGADDVPRFRFPAEAEHVAGAIHKRQLEFATGLELAHELIAEWRRGERDTTRAAPLLVGPRRAPLWPTGLNGSITHTQGLCVVAVGRRRYLGIDVEVTAPLKDELWPSILTVSERARLKGLGSRGGLLSKVHFSAKESVYKAISARVGRVVEFAEVEIRVSLALGTFDVVPMLREAIVLPPLRGMWRLTRDYIATSVVSPDEDKRSKG